MGSIVFYWIALITLGVQGKIYVYETEILG